MPTDETKGYNIDTQLKAKNKKKTSNIDTQLALNKVGRTSVVTAKILEVIAGADSSLSPQKTHVLPNWKTPVNYLTDNFPVVTLRVGTANITEKVYGRQLSSTERGHYVTYSFSAHVWHEKTIQLFEEPTYGDEDVPLVNKASILADSIIDVLEKYKGDLNSGICYFEKITARESEPERGPQRLTRMIIEGLVVVKRSLA